MTSTKQPWYNKINWSNVGKGVAAFATACGIGFGVSTTSLFTEPDADVGNRLQLHVATDSVRAIYIQERLDRMDKNMEKMMSISTDTRDIVIRLEAKAQK